MRAVCIQCGADKFSPLQACSLCGYRPKGEERSLSWLFSDRFLSRQDLIEAADRIVAGENPAPPERLMVVARQSIQTTRRRMEQVTDYKRRMTIKEQAWLGLGNLAFTPLLGLAVWWGWRVKHPAAAWRALMVTGISLMPLSLAWWRFWTL